MTRSTGFSVFAAALVAAAGSVLAGPPIADEAIVRETNGQRDALTVMEMKPFSGNWSTLTDWTGGEALTAAATKDKVVLIAFWSSWIESNNKLMARLSSLQEKYGKDGLIVVAVHSDTRFDNAAKVMSERGIKLLSARDAGNKLRASLMSDGDPDVYMIDRAGDLRYADIDSLSVETAVKNLTAETADQASGSLDRFIKELKETKDAAARTKIVGTGIDPGKKLKVSFTPPDPTAYDKALWPAKNDEDNVKNVNNVQGQKPPFEFGTEEWLTEKPQFLGKVVVIDFWATWCVPCKAAMPLLDEMQKTYRDDLVIVGISGFKFNGQGNDEKYDQGEDRPTVERFLREHNSEYFHAFDKGTKLTKPMSVSAIPQMMVLSTDGIVRWQGNPHQPHFRDIVTQVIKVDPGVAARRKAEKAAIKNQGG
jgi:thiol-disulfide isomerase/thioredoxin